MFNNFLSIVQVLIISILMKMCIRQRVFSLFDGIQKNYESQKDEF